MHHRTVARSSDPLRGSARDRLNADASNQATTHPVLSRLIEEVRNERQVEARYDRVHNRHNRGP